MTQKKFFSKNSTVKLLLTMLLLFIGSSRYVNAQIKNVNSVPTEFISATKFTITKATNPTISFDAATPYFADIEIVSGSNELLESVVSTNTTDSEGSVVKRQFDFSAVLTGTYYAKGFLTGTLVYYLIEVKN